MTSAAEYVNHLNDGNLISILNEVVVEEGDAFC
jgi:hypothetical protein